MRSLTPKSPAAQRGVALVITLAFVVLLTGLFVAFFSRAMAERQVSNSSANLTKASLLAEGAADSIISNLKQEIAMSSGTLAYSSPGSPSGTSYFYIPLSFIPLSGTTRMALMLPQCSGTVASGVTGWSPNFLIRSANAVTNPYFFYGTNAAGASVSIPSQGTMVSSTTPSLNGRYISLSRWNKHYLLTGTDPLMTPLTSGSNAFAAPDWVLVTRAGTSPVQGALTSPSNLTWSATNATTVVGRYAYAIYHEGGLLDANVAGYPTTSTPYSPSNSDPRAAYKTASAFADLSLLPGINGLSPANQAKLINNLVGWRNNASAVANGSLTSLSSGAAGYTMSTTGSSPYGTFVQSNTTGFLTISSTELNNSGVLNTISGQSDKLFASRQELIQFVQNGLGLTGTNLNLLNYLTHFSRDLNQPSFIPGALRPGVLPFASGGNDKGAGTEDNLLTPTTFSTTTVNPAFLSVRVTGAGRWLRNDNSTAIPGEPLVKKRFALSRLAWLTYQGPSATRNIPASNPGTTSPDYDMWLLVNTYGVPASFLQQGTASAIEQYFGLSYVKDNINSIGLNDGTYKWKYIHGTQVSGTGAASINAATGHINTLGQVAALGREPDFFELLRAAVNVGSIGKPATPAGPNIGSGATPAGYQNRQDASVDAAIIQLGANVIDQADVDSYCTRILFNDGSTFTTPQEYRGIEDVPYLYRIRGQHIKVTESNPATTVASVSGTFYSIANRGTGVYQLVPEIWNPHNWKSSGTAYPGISPYNGNSAEFRILALSVSPADNASLGNITATMRSRNNGYNDLSRSYPSDPAMPPPFALSGSGTALTFSIPPARLDFFRESTLLNKPDLATRGPNEAGPPVGSQATSTGGIVNSYFKAHAYNGNVPNGRGWSAGTNYDNQKYIGFPLGIYPLWFIPATNVKVTTSGTVWAETTAVNLSGATNVTLRMQYLDPSSGQYVTYDEKFLPIPSAQANTGVGGNMDFFLCGSGSSVPILNLYGGNQQYNQMIGGDNYCMVTDPRSSRFSGMVYTSRNVADAFLPPPMIRNGANYLGWVDASSNALVSARPDYCPGWAVVNPGNISAGVSNPASSNAATAMGFYNAQVYGGGGLMTPA